MVHIYNTKIQTIIDTQYRYEDVCVCVCVCGGGGGRERERERERTREKQSERERFKEWLLKVPLFSKYKSDKDMEM